MRAWSVGIAAIVAMAARVGAQSGGTSAAVFLEHPASARALALGGAYTAVGGDDAVLFFNPAQLATREQASAGLSVLRFALESTFGAFSAATRVGPGTIGFGVQVVNYGS